jgi:26S proteasome regulatory subunit N13
MQSLFPLQRPGAGGFGSFGGREPISLVSFKAGKCFLSDSQSNGKFQVTPDTKKRGKIELCKGTDGMLHLRWLDRANGRVEDDRLVFPGELTFKKCKTGRENDRVYVLKFGTGSTPMLFWMQDKSAEKDNENVSKLNEYANNPAAADAAANAVTAANASAAGAPAMPPGIPGLTPEAWAQLMGLPPPTSSSGAGAVPSATSSAAPAAATAGSATAAAAAAPAAVASLDFSSLLGLAAPQAAAPSATPGCVLT